MSLNSEQKPNESRKGSPPTTTDFNGRADPDGRKEPFPIDTVNQLQPGFLNRGLELRLVPREVKSLLVMQLVVPRGVSCGQERQLPWSQCVRIGRFVMLDAQAKI